MISALIRWSARNLVLIVIAAILTTGAGLYALRHVPLDAIPDLSDTQVIIYTEYSGQAPQVIEDQVTYPLSTAMLSVPKSRVVRGFSFFGVSFVYVIFEDGTDIYWARSRVLEYLSAAQRTLPAGVTPSLGPDATGVGWVYQYAVVAEKRSLAELRSTQDWQVRFAVAKAEGVAEVASVGGFVKQYSVVVDPRRLKAFDLTLDKVRTAIRMSNMDVGGRVVELAETEFMVRGRGYLRGIQDIEQIVLKSEGGAPVLVRDVARVELVPDERRGVAELNGEGEIVSGIAVQRYGQNALSVIENVKARLAEVLPSLPEGTSIVPVYDRSDLIHRAIDTLKQTLIEESLIVALVCFVFLLHVRSALVAIITLPLGILIAYILMHALGISSNIMSLGGIAIAIGAMVDAAIVMIENAHKHLERAPPDKPRIEILIEAATEVGPALFFSLLIITVSFLPIFTLEAARGAAVQAAGLHQDVCDGRGCAAVRHPRSRAHGAVRAWAHCGRSEEPVEPVPDLGLSADDLGRAAGQDPDHYRGIGRAGGEYLAGVAVGSRVHAQPQRGHLVLHADHAARPVRHGGGTAAADSEQDHHEFPGGEKRGRQSRKSGNRHRSCPP